MKRQLRSAVERTLRLLPVARAAYFQIDQLQARLDAFEATVRRPQKVCREDPLGAAAQVANHSIHRLESEVPVMRTLDERVLIAARCRDADVLPKVPQAGAVVRQPDGTDVQIMFNGIKVRAGGYYGTWMQDLITRCQGHHEPQEEVLFAEVLKHLPAEATMLELGGFWSFYSIWFLTQDTARRSIVVEADPAHLAVGQHNAELNGCAPTFVSGFIGRDAAPPSPFQTEESGTVLLPRLSVPQLMEEYGIEHLDLLHCDAQGVELAVLESIAGLAGAGRLGWVVVSTHTHHISGDALTHQRCLAVLQAAGATILAEHDVQESFSGDGLIVAKFGLVPAAWRTPALSHSRYSESLFRNPLYDLAAAQAAPASPPMSAPLAAAALVDASSSMRARGSLLTLATDSPLGREGDTILMPFDKVMFPMTVGASGWSLETLAFLDKRLDPNKSYVSLDIGANVGLYTRQIALRFPNIKRFFCVEAEPENFRILQYNVGSLLDGRGALWNVALSDTSGVAHFFQDADNFGNYSLNNDAMRDRPFSAITVQAVETSSWMRTNLRLVL